MHHHLSYNWFYKEAVWDINVILEKPLWLFLLACFWLFWVGLGILFRGVSLTVVRLTNWGDAFEMFLSGAGGGVARSSPSISLGKATIDTFVIFWSKMGCNNIGQMSPKKELIQHETLAATAVSRFLSCCGSVLSLRKKPHDEWGGEAVPLITHISAGICLTSAEMPSRGSCVPSCRCPCALIAWHL